MGEKLNNVINLSEREGKYSRQIVAGEKV